MPLTSACFSALLLLEMGYAMTWPGPMATPPGLVAIDGISPRPTRAPDPAGIPAKLRKRASVEYPPPASWCGFVSGDYCM